MKNENRLPHRLAIIMAAENELDRFHEEHLEGKTEVPPWKFLCYKAQYEFMRQVCRKIPGFVFSPDETKAVCKAGDFLGRCWLQWVFGQATIEYESLTEIMEYVVEDLALKLSDELSDDENSY